MNALPRFPDLVEDCGSCRSAKLYRFMLEIKVE